MNKDKPGVCCVGALVSYKITLRWMDAVCVPQTFESFAYHVWPMLGERPESSEPKQTSQLVMLGSVGFVGSDSITQRCIMSTLVLANLMTERSCWIRWSGSDVENIRSSDRMIYRLKTSDFLTIIASFTIYFGRMRSVYSMLSQHSRFRDLWTIQIFNGIVDSK